MFRINKIPCLSAAADGAAPGGRPLPDVHGSMYKMVEVLLSA